MSQRKYKRKFVKHKLLLDEGFPVRSYFPRLTHRFDIKHIKADLNLSKLPDTKVYEIAAKQRAIVVTFNEKDFRDVIVNSNSGVIAVSAMLTNDQIEVKLLALLNRSKKRQLFGKVTVISGETKRD